MRNEEKCLVSDTLTHDIDNNTNKSALNTEHVMASKQKYNNSDDEDDTSVARNRTKVKKIMESDSETDKENCHKNVSSSSDSSDDNRTEDKFVFKKKSRIKKAANSESDSLSENDSKHVNNYDLSRTKVKSKTLQDKFKNLKNPIKKSALKQNTEDPEPVEFNVRRPSDGSDGSDSEYSCLKIKQKVKKKTQHSLSSICDPDTSDDDSNIKVKHQKSMPRSTKLTSPKAVRMSAKQAMENMQKIKSESNRMLRESEVSLPYHRPKALNLKDIMSRRRLAVTSDGKSMPIKMNNEQLKQYALLLEQRQKEMIELCKSDSEEEEEKCPEDSASAETLNKPKIPDESCDQDVKPDGDGLDSSDINDKIFDSVDMEQKMSNSKTNTLDEQNILESELSNAPLNGNDELTNQTILERISQKDEINAVEKDILQSDILPVNNICKGTEESQNISLHYNSEKTDAMDVQFENEITDSLIQETKNVSDNEKQKENFSDEFSDNDFSLEDFDNIIETTTVKDKTVASMEATLELKPKLTGAPGMVIDLDDDDGSNTPKKLTGVELLKERFTYFAKLQCLEDSEKDREKKFKPGMQHLKLKQALEDQIAAQRSLEWEKRLQEENKQKTLINTEGDNEEFDGENIEKLEAKIDEEDLVDEHDVSSSEEEIEDDVNMCDKPRQRNPMIDDEAEVSEDENPEFKDEVHDNADNNEDNQADGDDDSEEDDDSLESEQEEEQSKPKKGRILKAFEDSDDEDSKIDEVSKPENKDFLESQDDEIQLAQVQKSYSGEFLTSQECNQRSISTTDKPKELDTCIEDLSTQTFSILESGSEKINTEKYVSSEKLDVICETQPCSYENFDAIVGMCSGSFSQNLVTPKEPRSQLSQSQEFGDNVLALCTGKFYDNPLISQTELENGSQVDSDLADDSLNMSTDKHLDESINLSTPIEQTIDIPISVTTKEIVNPINDNDGENKLLKSILDELDDPEFDSPKPNKYFLGVNKTQTVDNTQLKKKFVIESDDETNASAEVAAKKKKRRKRRLEDRALQISDDEEEFSDQEEEAYESEIEEDNDKIVEYDSEENEVVPTKVPKKKRVGRDFFEQEAELTSEDEWMGSGDEDEAGLDRMEREAGDDDTFHQGKLQQELGEIHMREVLDQDKREVRLLQELLFEDGDLGDGHRQRKFRWKNADGEEEVETKVDLYGDTQEEEFESEEQWRKQRHEREMFLRKLKEKDNEDIDNSDTDITIENPCSKSLSPNISEQQKQETEKRIIKDVPSPKKPFTIFQQNFHNSLLARGRGALARLATLATPLAGDGDEGPKVNSSSNRGNFVFAALTPDEAEPKVIKRKADANPNTPRLLKKMRTGESNGFTKSLLDHL